MSLPDRIFFTGVPGSGWSMIAQEIESTPGYNITDRSDERFFRHIIYDGTHRGAYFGTGMEFPANLDIENLEAPYTGPGCRLHKSHEWAYMLDEIVEKYPDSWIILIYRNDYDSNRWWHAAGAWRITYPNYDFYVDNDGMKEHIKNMNKAILDFADKHDLKWETYRDDIKIATWKKT